MPVVPYDPGIARIWSLRTRPGVWPAAFRLLCTFAPVIVVDRRHMSEIVQFEVSWLERRDFVDKVYAVVSPEDARKAGDSTAGMKLVDEETLIASQWTGAGLNC